MAHGALTPIIGLRLLALAAGLRHNAEIGQPGLCFSAYGHKFGINHLAQEPRPRSMILRWVWKREELASASADTDTEVSGRRWSRRAWLRLVMQILGAPVRSSVPLPHRSDTELDKRAR